MKSIKIIPILKFTTIIIISLIITACKNKNSEERISDEVLQANIIKKCLKRIYQNGSKESYLVSSKYNKFEFNSFFRDNKVLEKYHNKYNYNKNKKKVLHALDWTEKQYDEIQEKINKQYLNQRNMLLPKLSSSKDSHTVYFFSGIHENLVFADVIDYCDNYTISDLNSPSFDMNQNFLSAGSIIFVMKDGEVAEMIFDSDITLEYQCND